MVRVYSQQDSSLWIEVSTTTALEIERARVIRPLNAARQAIEDEFVSANIYEIDGAIYKWHRFLEEVLGGATAASRRAQNVDMCAVWSQNYLDLHGGRYG